jgi:hypothetical protein
MIPLIVEPLRKVSITSFVAAPSFTTTAFGIVDGDPLICTPPTKPGGRTAKLNLPGGTPVIRKLPALSVVAVKPPFGYSRNYQDHGIGDAATFGVDDTS